MNKIRILFVLSTLAGGGAERVMLHILQHIDKKKFSPSLALVQCTGELQDMLPSNIPVYNLGGKRARYAIFSLAQVLDSSRFDIAFSTLNHMNSSLYLASKIVRNPPPIIMRAANFESISINNRLVYWLSRLSYPRAEKMVVMTEAMKQDLQANFGVPSDRIQVISNPVDVEMIHDLQREPVNHPWFQKQSKDHPVLIAVGSLNEQKGFSYLLKAFSLVLNQTSARLVILGKGGKHKELKRLAKELNVWNDVTFMGFKSNPFKYVAKANLFVLSSLWEGFPNVLIEAMACGTPVVSTDCLSGPSEIITNGENGLLVPPAAPEALAKAILKVLKDKGLATRLAEKGEERAKDFEAGKIVRKYEDLFESVSNEK